MALRDVVEAVWDWFRRNILEPANLTPESFQDLTGAVPRFGAILVGFVVLAKLTSWVLGRTFFSKKRVDPMVATLFLRLTQGTLVFLGFTAALTAFGINVFGVALTVGLVGAGLALGMQNTVANMMGGVSLALDKPFEVGDRIRLVTGEGGRETWGDVEEIGLRSTKILTVRRELVTIPNRVLDQQEIWNFSGRYPELRTEVTACISYDSDWRLAERTMHEIAAAHPKVLPFPPPRVLLRDFEDSGMRMELAVFIPDARMRRAVESDLRKEVKDRFDAAGIEIAFPYRTIVYKKDLPQPSHPARTADPVELPLSPRRLLVATAGAVTALSKAKTICQLAARLHADLVVVYITQRRHIGTSREGEQAASAFFNVAHASGVRVALRIEEGEVVDTIARVVEEEQCGGIVIGAPRPPVLLSWTSAHVQEHLRARVRVPVVVVPPDLRVDEREVEAARHSLDSIAPVLPDRPREG